MKISSNDIDQIVAIKEQMLPTLASTVITAKYKGKVDKKVNYIASIFAPRMPTISGMPVMSPSTKTITAKSLSTIGLPTMSSWTEMTFLA